MTRENGKNIEFHKKVLYYFPATLLQTLRDPTSDPPRPYLRPSATLIQIFCDATSDHPQPYLRPSATLTQNFRNHNLSDNLKLVITAFKFRDFTMIFTGCCSLHHTNTAFIKLSCKVLFCYTLFSKQQTHGREKLHFLPPLLP